MTQDLVLGAFTYYDYEQVRCWVNSIKMSGFDGDIVVFVGEATFETVDALIQQGIKVLCLGQQDEANRMYTHASGIPVHTERFFHFWDFLKDTWQDYRYVITTDMKDVVFQSNPSDWLATNLYSRLIFGSECLSYENEHWGRGNLQQAFGSYVYEWFKGNTIYNVGVLAGEAEYMKDLCLNIFHMSVNRPIRIVEQAAFNLLVQTQPYKGLDAGKAMNGGWVAHLGTVMDPRQIDYFRPFLLEPEPIWHGDRLETHLGEPFCVVHQYDRVPQVKAAFENYYR